MKHSLKTTIILISIFLFAQIIGLYTLSYDSHLSNDLDGRTIVFHEDTIIGPRPELNASATFAYIFLAIIFGTVLLLILIRFNAHKTWKTWFFLAIWMSCSIAFGVYVNSIIAIILALILAYFKFKTPASPIANITEIFMHTGIAILFVPILDLFSASMLLILISIYDAYAVWKSKHMVTLARFQTKSNLFAGFMIAEKPNQKTIPSKQKIKTTKQVNTAILGGGDIAFPLLFAGAALEHMLRQGITKFQALGLSFIISICAAIALALLFSFTKKKKFYPAMPFISLGCFLGLILIKLIQNVF